MFGNMAQDPSRIIHLIEFLQAKFPEMKENNSLVEAQKLIEAIQNSTHFHLINLLTNLNMKNIIQLFYDILESELYNYFNLPQHD